jgi:xylulokinase
MSTRSPLFLALDAGTTSFKAVLFDAEGHPIGHERAEIHLRHPRPLWAEVDADDWWRAAMERVPRLLALPGVRAEAVAAVGVTGAMHALVPVDVDGAVLAPTLTWFDQRCRPQAEALREKQAPAFEAVGGVHVHASSARLRWLRELRPDVVERTHCFLLAKDFLRQRLTGRLATDSSDARSTSMVDRRTGDWCRELIEAVLEVAAGKLPEIRPATEIAGPVTEAAAAALGLRAGTPVAIGMGDVPSTLLGVNAFRAGELCVYLGTGGWMARTLPPEGEREPRTAWAGSTLACGSAVNWVRRLFCPDEAAGAPPDYDAMERALASVPAGAEGLLFLPHLMGERGRCGDPDARGAFFGLTLGHTPAHLQRAVVEGVAFQIRREIDAAATASGRGAGPAHPAHTESTCGALPHESIILSGGAARSPQWRRVLAGVTGRRVAVPAVSDTTALGAALVAAVAVGHFSSARAGAAAWVRPGVTVEPSAEDLSSYAETYERFNALEAALQRLYQRGTDDWQNDPPEPSV